MYLYMYKYIHVHTIYYMYSIFNEIVLGRYLLLSVTLRNVGLRRH